MGAIKLFAGVLLIVGVVYICATLIPPYFSNYEFEDVIKSEAQMATYSTKPEDAIRDTIFKKAQDLEIPIAKENIQVKRSGAQGTGTVFIQANYTVHVELPGYPMDLEFNPSTRNKGAF